MKAVQTEGCLNLKRSFPIILIRECFHNNMRRLKWLKLSTLEIFKMVSKRWFVFISYIFVLVSPFEWQIYTIDSCWYRQLITLTQAQNAHVQFAVGCSLCSVFEVSAAFFVRRYRRKATTTAAFIAASSLKSPWCVPAFTYRYISIIFISVAFLSIYHIQSIAAKNGIKNVSYS